MQDSPRHQAAAVLPAQGGAQCPAADRRFPREESRAEIQKEIAAIREGFGLPKNAAADARLARAKPQDFPPMRAALRVIK